MLICYVGDPGKSEDVSGKAHDTQMKTLWTFVSILQPSEILPSWKSQSVLLWVENQSDSLTLLQLPGEEEVVVRIHIALGDLFCINRWLKYTV